jgi:transcription-repair coupling factor (superfamily II helicase)
MGKSKGLVKLQPDHKLVFRADWAQSAARLVGVRNLVAQLAEIAAAARKAA